MPYYKHNITDIGIVCFIGNECKNCHDAYARYANILTSSVVRVLPRHNKYDIVKGADY